MPVPFPFGKIDSIGARANELLSRPHFHGRVLTVVSNAVYLTSSEGEILWLGKSGLPRHSRAILGSFDPSAFRVGMSFRRNGTRLQFDNNVSLAWAEAPVWRPAAIRRSQITPRTTVVARVRELLDTLPLRSCGDSLGQIIPLVRAMLRGSAPSGVPTSTPFVNAAIVPCTEIAMACWDRDMARVLRTARALVGLGPGLTPGGDDFIGGLFFTTYHLCEAYAEIVPREQPPVDGWLRWAHAQTNSISYAILSDHAHGRSIEPLHDWIAMALRGEGLAEILIPVRRLLGVGDTSGWDMLAGALTAMLSVRQEDTLCLTCSRLGRGPV